MHRMILCEGITDAILLSYFLCKKFGWKFLKDSKSTIRFNITKHNQILNWYQHPDYGKIQLGIWGTGGLENIPNVLSDVMERSRNERNSENRFKKIVLFFDRDKNEDSECLSHIQEWMEQSKIILKENANVKIGTWIQAKTTTASKTPSESFDLDFLFCVLPPDKPGNLEIFLLDSLSKESQAAQNLVKEAERFIQKNPDDPYLKKQRLRPKAQLGSVLSVISPDWVFSKLDDRLKLIEWEKLEDIWDVYKKLEHMLLL